MRRDDWQQNFWKQMEIHRHLPFVWGVRDCVMFAADMADAVTVDGDYADRARAAFEWSDARDAVRLVGANGLRAMIESVLGPSVRWTECGHGDLILVIDERDRECLTVHDGTQLVGPKDDGDSGVQAVPFRYARCGWRVL